MKAEHTTRHGHDLEFTTPNFHITTTPAQEWAIVVDGAMPKEAHMQHGRRVRGVGSMMKEALVGKAGLTEAEVIAVALYTGPMVSCDAHCGGHCSLLVHALTVQSP